MGEAWHDGMPDDAFKTEAAKAYEKAAAVIREGLARGLDFDRACAAVDVGDEALRISIVTDMLKVLIAEEHFTKNIPLDDLARKLGIPVDRLESAKASMLEEVKEESIRAFYKSLGSGNA